MVEWCAQNLHRNGSIARGTSHATPKERYQYTTSVDINNTRYTRIQSLIQNYMPMRAVSLLVSREQRYTNATNNNSNNNSTFRRKSKLWKQTELAEPYRMPQISQQKGHCWLCVKPCSCSSSFLTKVLPHTSQCHVLSPLWRRM